MAQEGMVKHHRLTRRYEKPFLVNLNGILHL